MSALKIYLFGQIRIIPGGATEPVKLQRSSQSLLAYLLLQPGRLCSREQVIDSFWGEACKESGRNCLTTALWRLRNVLESGNGEAGKHLITTDASEVGFNWQSDYWLDLERFEQAVSPILRIPVQAMQVQDAAAMEHALALYQGELLQDLYEDWALRARERLRCLHLNSLAHLMDYHAYHHDYAASLDCGRQILEADPLREEIHRSMMRLYVSSGRRARALRQYEICRQALKEELGIAPMGETEALYHSIVESGAGDLGPAVCAPEPAPALAASHALALAMQRVETARHQLDEALALLQACMARPAIVAPGQPAVTGSHEHIGSCA